MKIPGYEILRVLGEGGMATVYLAKQERLGRQVALKVMQPATTVGYDFTARFIKEGQIIARLQHPRIVTIYDLDVADGVMYFSMEYLPNGTLAELIAKGLSPSRAVAIARGIAEALAFAHGQGIIHRDIKPQNILFRADGNPVLTDFGIARAVTQDMEATQLTSVGMVVGSPRYMSPEQCMSGTIDARSDLYSLGVVLYQMLAQELPYQGTDVVTLAMAHCSAPIPVLGRRLRAYQPVLERLLAKAPEDRYPDAAKLIDDLRAIEADLSAAGTTPKTDRKRPQPARATGRRWLIGAAAVLGILAAVGTYRALVPTDNPADPEPPQPPAEPRRPQVAVTAEKEALALLDQGRIDAALDRVSAGLVEVSGDAGLMALKDRLRNERYARTVLSRANAQAARSDLTGALRTLERAIERLPDHPGLREQRDRLQARLTGQRQAQITELLETGRKSLQRGDPTEASRMVSDGLKLDPENLELRALKARIDTVMARTNNRNELIEQANELAAEGLLSESLEAIAQARALNPEDAELLDLQTTVERQLERERTAQARTQLERAEALRDQGKLAKALATVDAALRGATDDEDLLALRKALLAAQQANDSQALRDRARTALDAGDIDAADALNAQARALATAGQAADQLDGEIEQAKARATQLAGRITRAEAALAAKAFSEAITSTDEGLALDPLNERLLAIRAAAIGQQHSNREQEIAEVARQVDALSARGALAQALRTIDATLTRHPDEPRLLLLRDQIDSTLRARQSKLQALAECRKGFPPDGPWLDEDGADTTAAAACYRPLLAHGDTGAEAADALATITGRLTEAFDAAMERGYLPQAEARLTQLRALNADEADLASMQQRLSDAAAVLPTLVRLPAGCYAMGSPADEPGREDDEQTHRACVDALEVGVNEVTVADFRRFVDATGYSTDAERGIGGVQGCWAFGEDKDGQPGWGYQAWATWRTPNREHDNRDQHPVSCVSWNDARAYIDWLNAQTEQSFRLPTEEEWEYAARAGVAAARWWQNAPACGHANVADTGHGWDEGFPCDDRYEWVSPVGSFAANPWGLHDVLGNVWEWTCSEYDTLYRGTEETCADPQSTDPRVLRGGSWNSGPALVRAAYRNRNFPEARYNFVGFRLARAAPPPADAP